MKRIAKFEKVSAEQFAQGYGGEDAAEVYGSIRLPERATSGSAGYDIFAPFDIELKAGETVKVPTGIRVRIAEGWLLAIYPRSGLGFKFRLQWHSSDSRHTLNLLTRRAQGLRRRHRPRARLCRS